MKIIIDAEYYVHKLCVLLDNNDEIRGNIDTVEEDENAPCSTLYFNRNRPDGDTYSNECWTEPEEDDEEEQAYDEIYANDKLQELNGDDLLAETVNKFNVPVFNIRHRTKQFTFYYGESDTPTS